MARLIRAGLKLGDWRGVLARRSFAGLRDRFYRDLWAAAAAAVGAEARPAPGGMTELRRGRRRTYVLRAQTMLDGALTDRLLADKALSYALFSEIGVPVPDHAAFDLSDLSPAEALLRRAPGGIVVKPAAGTGAGHGVTTGIADRAALRRAARHAAAFNPRLLAEPVLEGASWRLLYLDGTLIDTVRRDPPAVTGDGRRSVAQLITEESRRRRAANPVTALNPLTLDADARLHLSARGLGPGHVPTAGQTVVVKRVVNQNAAAQNHTHGTAVHPEIATAGSDLVRRIGVRLAGVDLMAPTLDVPLARSGGVFGEINVAPGLHHHVLVSDPAARVPVAERILDHIFDSGEGALEL
ncbi:cyanophycin synthetase [Rhodobacteraceae bacterium CCMM004]|nr:cyanophycin synthetase [Rhodobacteraceae bacterium CCMM004]